MMMCPACFTFSDDVSVCTKGRYPSLVATSHDKWITVDVINASNDHGYLYLACEHSHFNGACMIVNCHSLWHCRKETFTSDLFGSQSYFFSPRESYYIEVLNKVYA